MSRFKNITISTIRDHIKSMLPSEKYTFYSTTSWFHVYDTKYGYLGGALSKKPPQMGYIATFIINNEIILCRDQVTEKTIIEFVLSDPECFDKIDEFIKNDLSKLPRHA